MLGLQPDSRGLVKSEDNLKKALHRFVTQEAGPGQAVYGREDDGDEALYANWPFLNSVRSLIAFLRDLRWATWSGWQTRWLEGAIAQILADFECLRLRFLRVAFSLRSNLKLE
jgi:hypothetical protein